MTATTESFLALQRLYRERAEADAAVLERRARALLKALGRDPDQLRRATVRLFAKNARNLRCVPAVWARHGVSVVRVQAHSEGFELAMVSRNSAKPKRSQAQRILAS